MKHRLPLIIVTSIFLGLASTGCSVQHADRKAQMSFASWNLRSACSTPEEACWSPALALASKKPRELRQLMKTCPAPDPCQLNGPWLGINKGIGAALANVTQDIKVFETDGCDVHGYNIAIRQVPIDHLECCGWEPEVDSKTCEVKTGGKFIVQKSDPCSPLKLDYTVADNKWNDPSKILIDDLVMVGDDLLLGQAHAKIGLAKIPVAFFVLYRSDTNESSSDQRLGGETEIGRAEIDTMGSEENGSVVASDTVVESSQAAQRLAVQTKDATTPANQPAGDNDSIVRVAVEYGVRTARNVAPDQSGTADEQGVLIR